MKKQDLFLQWIQCILIYIYIYIYIYIHTSGITTHVILHLKKVDGCSSWNVEWSAKRRWCSIVWKFFCVLMTTLKTKGNKTKISFSKSFTCKLKDYKINFCFWWECFIFNSQCKHKKWMAIETLFLLLSFVMVYFLHSGVKRTYLSSVITWLRIRVSVIWTYLNWGSKHQICNVLLTGYENC